MLINLLFAKKGLRWTTDDSSSQSYWRKIEVTGEGWIHINIHRKYLIQKFWILRIPHTFNAISNNNNLALIMMFEYAFKYVIWPSYSIVTLQSLIQYFICRTVTYFNTRLTSTTYLLPTPKLIPKIMQNPYLLQENQIMYYKNRT